MKKSMQIALGVCLMCSLGLNAYSIYSIRNMDSRYQEQTKELGEARSLVEDYKGKLRKLELKAEETNGTTEEKTEDPKTDLTDAEESKNQYTFEGFEDVYSAFATQGQIDAVKEAVTEALEKSEYKSIENVRLSAYTRYDQDKFLEYTYARLDDKAVMEIAYSIRYGTATASLSDLTQKELGEMEKYGTTVVEPGEETTASPAEGDDDENE